ncbi:MULTISPECIES: hypothetical protein [Pseudoalteromonas]|uniref:hypothetical protein n=1 Tax=Pseudoalteromonas TaxID=53246 RepID=UPI0007844C59|nr:MULTISPECIES: hypothetical protein [Pseudoalteromonas]MCF7520092.1 hypothetical protein [Pseudoalteromonas sp. L21]|tara:strand:+ start:6827 stop:7522 length:696 start_codon:yes stop_codon:yes gene_type:complete
MSIVNMFRKEALRNQYKSSDIGKSLIKQPKVINNSILFLIFIFIAFFLLIKIISIPSSKSLAVKISAENYTPLIYSEVAIIKSYLSKNGGHVRKDQPLISISKLNNKSSLESDVIRSPSDGFFFHSKIDKNITQPYKPLGYLLTPPADGELSFWISNTNKINLNVNDKATLHINDEKITATVTMVINGISSEKEQKIHLRIKENEIQKLSPNAEIKIVLNKQDEKIINLIK